MIIASLIIFLSGQSMGVVDSMRCGADIRALQDSSDPITEVYREAIHSLTIYELRQIKESPLQVPRPEKLTSFSAAFPILEKIIPHLRAHETPGLSQELRTIIESEIAIRSQEVSSHKRALQNTHHLEKDLIIETDSPLGKTLLVSPDGQTLYSSTTDHKILKFNSTTGKLMGVFDLSNWPLDIGSIALSPDGKILFVGVDEYLLRYNTDTFQNIDETNRIIKTGSKIIYLGTYHRLNLLYSVQKSGTMYTKDGSTGINLKGRDGRFIRLSFYWPIPIMVSGSTTDETINIGFPSGSIIFLKSLEPQPKINLEVSRSVSLMLISPNERLVFTTVDTILTPAANHILVWDSATGRLIPDPKHQLPLPLIDSKPRSLAISPDGKYLFSSFENREIHRWYLPDYIPPEYFDPTP